MKKAFAYRLCVVIVISMFVMILLSGYLQITSAKDAAYANSVLRIDQISQILGNNSLEIERLKESLEEDYFIRAKAAAYIVQNNPEVINDLKEIKKVASLLQVDELHLFDTDGRLFSGSEPKYYDFTFNSGEQMQFFLPMLEDYSLQLCQDVVPNTAESKLMQYIAVWREDRQGIIQIGMEPIRLMEAMSKNELGYILSMVTSDKDTEIFVADAQTGLVAGATNESITGKKLEELFISGDTADYMSQTQVNATLDGRRYYCVIRQADDVLIGVGTTVESLYGNIRAGMLLVVVCLSILSVIIIVLILKLLDRFIIHDIHEIISDMDKIATGDLDHRIKGNASPEFIELSDNINHLVISLLETTGKLSLVLENVDIPIAVYEYGKDMKRVLATSKIGDILRMSEEELSLALSDHGVFKSKILEICAQPFRREEDVFMIKGEEIRYVKMKSYQEDRKTLGIIVDVTEEVLEKQQIELERDIDLLTGLYNRRAFYNESSKLFARPDMLNIACLLMLDIDNLKYANDNWGHEYGDRLIKATADILNQCEAPYTLSSRLGGDEFALLLYNAGSQEEIQGYIDRLYDRFTASGIEIPGGRSLPICLSGGYVFYPEDSVVFNQMLDLADQAMYRVKKDTKGYFAKYVK